jgi:class 3 adenylate cyclase
MWDLLSNTEHLNRTIGLPSVVYSVPSVGEDSLYREASARVMGVLPMKWKEYPFEWVQPERYVVLREFEGGPIARFWGGMELEATENGTRVRVFADITPRGAWAVSLASLIGQKGVRDTLTYCEKFVSLAQTNHPSPLPRGNHTRVARAAMDRILARLKRATPASPALIDRLGQHIAEGTDEEVLRMKPFALAGAWNTNREDVLRLFLYATREGLLHLDWELMCPNCRVPKAEYRSLQELASEFHCDLCGVNYEADMDRYVELRFSVNPEVRAAEDTIYCIGGPVNTPHILIQQYLPPGEERVLTPTLGDDLLRARALRSNQTSVLNPSRSGQFTSDEIILTYREDGWHPARQTFEPGRVNLRWRNASRKLVVAVLEKREWDQQAVTAAQVTAMQEFRNLFSSEVLSPGRQIGVRNLCVLFTDLKKSTFLYELVGDASAFGRVRRHFDFLTDVIQRNRGGIVKTIGDAVMAVFPTEADAVRAGMEIQTGIGAFNRRHELDPPIIIKLGVHHGTAIAVNANDHLDYFGRTVNIAARIQNESEGGDVVLTQEVFEEEDIQDVLKDFAFEVVLYETVLKDIEGTFRLCRLVPNNAI